MLLGRKLTILNSLLIVVIPTICPTAAARSVYVISDTLTSQVQAYEVNDSNLTYHTAYMCQSVPPGSTGAVGLALDPESEILFVTYEASNLIEMVNVKTMIYEQNGLIPRKPRIHTAFSEFSSKNQSFNQHLPLQRRHIYGSAAEACPAHFHDFRPNMRPNAVSVRIYLVCPLFR